MNLSDKQIGIVNFIRSNGNITKKQAVEMYDHCYYYNGTKYIGEILSNMVKRGYIKRVKNGVFELGNFSNQLAGIVDKNQINLF